MRTKRWLVIPFLMIFALGCGLESQEFDGCWGLASEDARRLAANIVLYALTH